MSSAPPQQVGRPQPQTTREQQGGPFIRYTQPGNLPQWLQATQAFGGFIQNPLVARPGYYRDFRLYFVASAGVNGGTANIQSTTDGQFAVASLIQFKDPFGTLIFSLPSFEASLVHQYSGGAGTGLKQAALIANLPSYSSWTLNTGTGNFSWALTLPLEFAKGIGTAPGANASVQPTLSIQLAASTAVYTVTGSGQTTPTVAVQCESDFYWLPDGQDIAPPALGTSRQWILQQGNPTISSAGNNRVSFPRLGGYLDTLILEGRDTGNGRTSWFPGFTTNTSFTAPVTTNTSRMVLYIDGVPIEDNPWWKALDDQFIAFGAIPAPSGAGSGGLIAAGANISNGGTYVYTRKNSLSQQSEGLLDTGETTISTNPGTLIEVQGQNWGTFGNSPVTLNVIVGQIIPRGRMVQGLPEV